MGVAARPASSRPAIETALIRYFGSTQVRKPALSGVPNRKTHRSGRRAAKMLLIRLTNIPFGWHWVWVSFGGSDVIRRVRERPADGRPYGRYEGRLRPRWAAHPRSRPWARRLGAIEGGGLFRAGRPRHVEAAPESGELGVGHGHDVKPCLSSARRRWRGLCGAGRGDGARATTPPRFAPGAKDNALARV